MKFTHQVPIPKARPRSNINDLQSKEYKVFEYIFNKFLYSNTPLENYMDISRVHFHKRFGTYYYKLLQSLEAKGILQINHSWQYFVCDETTTSKTKPYCKKYRLNPSLFGAKLRKEDTFNKLKPKPSNRLLLWTHSNLQKITVTVPSDGQKAIIDKIINKDFVQDRYIDANLLPDDLYFYVRPDGKKSTAPYSLDGILNFANGCKLDALFCKNKRIIITGKRNEIFSIKERELKTRYLELLRDFERDTVKFIDRNDTNNRLTTPFTVFPSVLLKYLKLDNQAIKQIDISNSQFCILSNIIQCYQAFKNSGIITPIIIKAQREGFYFKAFKKAFYLLLDDSGNFKEDAQSFLSVATSGKLYENVQDQAEPDNMSRSQAKKGMFIVAFSHYSYNPPLKKKLTEIYPSIINFIDAIKKELPKKDKVKFAVFLQKIESYICIDNVLQVLKKHKIKTLTRHDSFCVPSNDYLITELLVKSELRRMLPYGFNLKN